MKKLLTAVVLSSILLMNTAFANKKDNVNTRAESTFKQEFASATDVSWAATENYYKASFKMSDVLMTAYFAKDGAFIGVTRNLLSTQLPINLQSSLKKEYGNYWITELFEFAQPESNGYFITLQNADQTITLSSSNGSSWSTYTKARKL
jgi:hypothetical protein